MRNSFTILIILLFGIAVQVQAVTNYFFYVQLTDKKNNPFSVSQPEAYLSQKAITRRALFNLSCDSTDLPVNPSYVSSIANLGVKIHSRTKWLNGITVQLTDSNLMSQVRLLPFVKWARFSGKMEIASGVKAGVSASSTAFNYGTAAAQINQLNGTALHNAGYTGRGIHVGVLDAGFKNININAGLDSLRLQGRLLGTKDIAELNANVYNLDSHGANVLSIMAGNIPGSFLGTAPHASYWLIRTEYAPSEYMMEVDFWVSGIEFADSVGVDIVNSSLGYTTFDDASMNYTYADMNGKVSRASRAAKIAADKGIVVCNSAGNSGSETWKYLGAPSDAEGIFAIGAAYSNGTPSTFTSYGPSSDGRVKPEISAMGTSTALINTSGNTATGNGTSYSSPVLCGMLACFLQYSKATKSELSMNAIRESVIQSSSLYTSPSDRLGYGFPNFQQAMANLTTYNAVDKNSISGVQVTAIPEAKTIKIQMSGSETTNKILISIYDITGKIQFSKLESGKQFEISTANFASGIYVVSLNMGSETHYTKLIIR